MVSEWLFSLSFWGVWLVIPIAFDGVIAASYMFAVIRGRARRVPLTSVEHAPRGVWPRITIIVPIYNSSKDLAACIGSIRAQSYPHHLIEVLAVDNGSRDDSFRVFCEEQQRQFAGSIHWLSTFHQGKPWALNVGIHHALGEYIINLDSDVALHQHAIANMVAAFERDPEMVAATGAVETSSALSDPTRHVGPLLRIIRECEFHEYHFAFNVGRRFESESGQLFTLAGAFSGFRRESLLQSHMYDTSTVGEDTYMTFDIRERFPGRHVAVVPAAVCYTEPIPSIRALYAQRVRWQRGEIEVIAAHPQLASRGIFSRGFSPLRTLLIDHTLAFPRVAWTVLLPALSFFGYSWESLFGATVALFVGYVGIETLTWLTNATLATRPTSARLWRGWWIVPLMPVYRYATFWMRVGGMLTVLTEPHQWSTTDPVTATRRELLHLVGRRDAVTSRAA
jgi:putative glycosyltransferase (exosortase G-associated)